MKRLLLNRLSSNCHIGSCRLRMLADDISCCLDRRARVMPWPITKQGASKSCEGLLNVCCFRDVSERGLSCMSSSLPHCPFPDRNTEERTQHLESQWLTLVNADMRAPSDANTHIRFRSPEACKANVPKPEMPQPRRSRPLPKATATQGATRSSRPAPRGAARPRWPSGPPKGPRTSECS